MAQIPKAPARRSQADSARRAHFAFDRDRAAFVRLPAVEATHRTLFSRHSPAPIAGAGHRGRDGGENHLRGTFCRTTRTADSQLPGTLPYAMVDVAARWHRGKSAYRCTQK